MHMCETCRERKHRGVADIAAKAFSMSSGLRLFRTFGLFMTANG